MVDNTFASPIITKPLALGADMAIHSVTKYLSGHSDVTAGVVVCRHPEDLQRVQQVMMVYGLNLSPFESWLAARGLKTLRLRMRQHSRTLWQSPISCKRIRRWSRCGTRAWSASAPRPGEGAGQGHVRWHDELPHQR